MQKKNKTTNNFIYNGLCRNNYFAAVIGK